MDVFARDSGFISGCPAYGPDPVLRPPAMALEHPGSAASHALPNPELDTVSRVRGLPPPRALSGDEELAFCGMLHNGSHHSPKSALYTAAHNHR